MTIDIYVFGNWEFFAMIHQPDFEINMDVFTRPYV